MARYRTRHNSLETQLAAREMRKQSTPAEDRLWQALRGSALGVRFRRQHPVGRFILDFWCPAARLVVEVDGDIHDVQEERDAERTEMLELHGYHVIRFRNEEVIHDRPAVLARIHAEVSARGVVLPPLLQFGRGGPGG